MQSVLHQFLQSLAATVTLAFILELGLTCHSTWTLSFLSIVQSNPIVVLALSILRFLVLILILVLCLLCLAKYFVIAPKFITNLTTLCFLALGLGLLGVLKLTIGEFSPFTLGFLHSSKHLNAPDDLYKHNPVRVVDYSTMYSSPHGYLYFLIMILNLIGVRSFSHPQRAGDQNLTALESHIELKQKAKRRGSIHEDELFVRQETHQDPQRMSATPDLSFEDIDKTPQSVSTEHADSLIENNLTALKNPSFKLKSLNKDLSPKADDELSKDEKNAFDLYEKEFSEESADDLSVADSSSSKIKSTTSLFFLEKFTKLKKKSTLAKLLLKLKDNSLHLDMKRRRSVLFWTMNFDGYMKFSSLLTMASALVFFLSGNAFLTDLLFAFIFSKLYCRFYFRVIERSVWFYKISGFLTEILNYFLFGLFLNTLDFF